MPNDNLKLKLSPVDFANIKLFLEAQMPNRVAGQIVEQQFHEHYNGIKSDIKHLRYVNTLFYGAIISLPPIILSGIVLGYKDFISKETEDYIIISSMFILFVAAYYHFNTKNDLNHNKTVSESWLLDTENKTKFNRDTLKEYLKRKQNLTGLIDSFLRRYSMTDLIDYDNFIIDSWFVDFFEDSGSIDKKNEISEKEYISGCYYLYKMLSRFELNERVPEPYNILSNFFKELKKNYSKKNYDSNIKRLERIVESQSLEILNTDSVMRNLFRLDSLRFNFVCEYFQNLQSNNYEINNKLSNALKLIVLYEFLIKSFKDAEFKSLETGEVHPLNDKFQAVPWQEIFSYLDFKSLASLRTLSKSTYFNKQDYNDYWQRELEVTNEQMKESFLFK